MMPSQFYISIKRHDGGEVMLMPGGQGERDLLAELQTRLREQGVGWFTSEKKVIAALETALRETLWALKSDVRPHVNPHAR